MAAVARKDGTDTINTGHGCDGTTVTDQGSSTVFVNKIGAVRAEDLCLSHLIPAGIICVSHTVALTTYSSTVFVNGKGVGRVGDEYSGHIISSGSSNVFAGG
jgi:uncharacterized Zn-binding protein involved in type VI secretion